ncbi:MAG: hypothetical protein ACRYF2_16155 [Janthinobacterium lividum]
MVISVSWDRPDAQFRALFEARAALLAAGLTAPYFVAFLRRQDTAAL